MHIGKARRRSDLGIASEIFLYSACSHEISTVVARRIDCNEVRPQRGCGQLPPAKHAVSQRAIPKDLLS